MANEANIFDETDIEDAMREFIRSKGISKTVFTNRPKVSKPGEDFVVVNTTGKIDDLMAFGRCTIMVSLFARDVNEQKNGKKLSVMYKKLASCLPATVGKLMLEGTPTIICDAADDYGFHARIININTIIKV